MNNKLDEFKKFSTFRVVGEGDFQLSAKWERYVKDQLIGACFLVEHYGKGVGSSQVDPTITDHSALGCPDFLVRSPTTKTGLSWIEVTGTRKDVSKYPAFIVQS